MMDRVWEQIGNIQEVKDWEALEALYNDALEKEDWKLAHDRLLELALKLLNRSTKRIADLRRQQEVTSREIKALEKRLASFLR